MNKKNSAYLLTALAAAVISAPASAAITLYEQDGTSFSADGYINAFYVQTDTDNVNDVLDRDQARVKMGFLPNYIGFNVDKQMDNLRLGARSSFWVTINDSETNATSTGIDVRQFYGTIGSTWGEVLVGKDFGLFARSNIFVDEFLAGYGQVSDTLGLVDGGGVSFGNIGSGYPYPFPTAQITYRSPVMSGFRIAAGIMDPVDTNQGNTATGKAYQDTPRFETEITHQMDLGDAKVFSWINGAHQSSKNTDSNVDSLTSKGLGYGVQVKLGAASLTASGFNAEGVNPLFTNNALEPVLGDGDTKGHLLQASYTFGGKTRVAVSAGQTKDDGALFADAKLETRAIGVFHSINDNLTLVAEYNQFELEDRVNRLTIEETDTIALGVVVSW